MSAPCINLQIELNCCYFPCIFWDLDSDAIIWKGRSSVMFSLLLRKTLLFEVDHVNSNSNASDDRIFQNMQQNGFEKKIRSLRPVAMKVVCFCNLSLPTLVQRNFAYSSLVVSNCCCKNLVFIIFVVRQKRCGDGWAEKKTMSIAYKYFNYQ